MPREHKKNHNLALLGAALVTILIIILWVRVLLPLQQAKNRQDSVPVSELIESVVPDNSELPTQNAANEMLLPREIDSYQQ